MARLIRLINELPSLIDQIYECNRIADENREIEYNAAVKLQSWYRGIRTRAYLKHLNQNAIVIQKCWRGYLGRRRFRHVLEYRLKEMRLNYYNEKARLIQKTWRGFYSRKYIFDYYKRKAYLQAIAEKNQVILNELREYKEYMEKKHEENRNMMRLQRLEEEAKRNHYLVSTKQIPGVYNSPYKPAPDEMEYRMQRAKLEPSKKHEEYVKPKKFETIPLPVNLPPLNVKPQGPFRDPIDVRRQRYRPLSPSLRVQTEFDSLEKAREALKYEEKANRLHDDIFYPIDKTIYRKPYEPLMLTRDKYKLLDYGRKYFREDKPEDQEKRFKTIVPTVPEFNKLNQTYVESHYYY